MRCENHVCQQCIKQQTLQSLKNKPANIIIVENLQLILMHHGMQG